MINCIDCKKKITIGESQRHQGMCDDCWNSLAASYWENHNAKPVPATKKCNRCKAGIGADEFQECDGMCKSCFDKYLTSRSEQLNAYERVTRPHIYEQEQLIKKFDDVLKRLERVIKQLEEKEMTTSEYTYSFKSVRYHNSIMKTELSGPMQFSVNDFLKHRRDEKLDRDTRKEWCITRSDGVIIAQSLKYGIEEDENG